LQSVIGLSLGDGHIRAVSVTRAKGAVEVVKATSAPMTLDLAHPEPELVGREIRNHLDAAGIRERHCVVALPAQWVMSQPTRVPELSPEDLSNFLQMEAEKAFPVDVAQLQIARSFYHSAEGNYVTQFAVRKEHLDQLSAVMQAAGLKPVSYSLGLAALPGVVTAAGMGRITVAVETTGTSVLISAGGGIVALRTGEATVASEGRENVINGGAVARELRITFEQVPPDLRGEIKGLSLCGEEAMVSQLSEGLVDWAKAANLPVTRNGSPGQSLADQLAENVATHWMGTEGLALEFLPPRPSQWSLLVARYNSKRLGTIGLAVAAVVILVLGAFGWLEFTRLSLQSRWDGMQTQVVALQAVRSKILEYRPWYDTTYHDLTIVRRVTECFPDNGSVTARSVEIKGTSAVTISGTARDYPALLQTMDKMRKAKEIQGLTPENMRGKAPMQFTLNFRWNGTPGS
jgi:hypothetical protein